MAGAASRWSRCLIPSTLDDTLCPPGQHVASLFCQHVAPQLPDGKSWDDHREDVADLMIATVDKYAPGFAASVIGRQILSPLDLERQFGLHRRRYFSRRADAQSTVLGAADARPCRLPRASAGSLPLRQRRASRRRRHRRARPQRRARDPGGSPGAVQVSERRGDVRGMRTCLNPLSLEDANEGDVNPWSRVVPARFGF